MNTYRNFGTTPWVWDRPIARPLPTRENTTQKNVDIHPCFERVRTTMSVFQRSKTKTGLTPRGHWDRILL